MSSAPSLPVIQQNPTEAQWISDRLTAEWGTVTAVVPAGYAAYVRLLHPIELDDGSLHTWQEVATDRGTVTHPLVQWVPLLGRRCDGDDIWWGEVTPEEGNLHPVALLVLLSVLAQHTTTRDDCWFCSSWFPSSDGKRPTLSRKAAERSRATRSGPPDSDKGVVLPGANVALARGSLVGALNLTPDTDWHAFQSPNLFWPADRSWCVSTNIDLNSTIIAGNTQLAEHLLQSNMLETWSNRTRRLYRLGRRPSKPLRLSHSHSS